MKTIHKYPIQVVDDQTVMMPVNAEILCCKLQNDCPTIWAKVDTDNKMTYRKITVRGTGHPCKEDDGKYIDTFFYYGGLVFHVFDGGEA